MAAAHDSNAACEAEFGCELISSPTSASLGPYCKQAGMLRDPELNMSSRISLSRMLILIQRHREQRCLQAPTYAICMAREVFLTGSFHIEPLLFHHYKKKSL